MELLKKIWNDPVWSKVIAGLFILFLTFLISKIFSGNWFYIFLNFQIEIWLIIIIMLLLLIIIFHYIKVQKKRNYPTSYEIFSTKPWKDLFEKNLYGVLWTVRTYEEDIWDAYFGKIYKPEDLHIKNPPHCPNCLTELKEKKKFFGYRWFCVKCNFNIKSRYNLYERTQDATKIVQGEYRKYLNKKINKLK